VDFKTVILLDGMGSIDIYINSRSYFIQT